MPVVFIDAPPGIGDEAKREMMQKVTDAVEGAYHIGETLVFLREHQLNNVALNGGLQSDNPELLEILGSTSAP